MTLSKKKRGGGNDSRVIEEIIKHLEYFMDLAKDVYEYHDSLKVVDILKQNLELISQEVDKLTRRRTTNPSLFKLSPRFQEEDIKNLKELCHVDETMTYGHLINKYVYVIQIIGPVYDTIVKEKTERKKKDSTKDEPFKNLDPLIKEKFQSTLDINVVNGRLKAESVYPPPEGEELRHTIEGIIEHSQGTTTAEEYKERLTAKAKQLENTNVQLINYLKHYYIYDEFLKALESAGIPYNEPNTTSTKARSESSGGKKWSLKYKQSINCRRPKGFSQKQYCKRQGKKTRRI
jgi:hypothetical protein